MVNCLAESHFTARVNHDLFIDSIMHRCVAYFQFQAAGKLF